jgi:hypothetical protein
MMLGDELANAAIAQVEEAADPDWKQAAAEAIEQVARERDFFTTDHVWMELGPSGTHEPRAMGAMIRQAAAAGVCRITDRTTKSARPCCHRRPLRVWESLWRTVG